MPRVQTHGRRAREWHYVGRKSYYSTLHGGYVWRGRRGWFAHRLGDAACYGPFALRCDAMGFVERKNRERQYKKGVAVKSRPGVCDVCGCAVVRLSGPPANGYLNGHHYQGGLLKSVRCSQHPEDDMAPIARLDARGGGPEPSWELPRAVDGEE